MPGPAACWRSPRRSWLIIQLPVRAVTSGWPAPGWVFVACDVGQGDGLVLAAGPGRAVVIDSGPDPVAMSRCLDDLGITDVPLLVFSHYHLDHVGGITGVFHGRTVHRVETGPLAAPTTGVDLVAADAAGARVGHRLRAGRLTVTIGSVRLDYLAPSAAFRGTRSDPEQLLGRHPGHGRAVGRSCCPGDAEIEAQQSLLYDRRRPAGRRAQGARTTAVRTPIPASWRRCTRRSASSRSGPTTTTACPRRCCCGELDQLGPADPPNRSGR